MVSTVLNVTLMPRQNEISSDRVAREAVRLRVVEGARRHFFAHGFRNVTMDDLATELGMSKKTLYFYFASKSDLLREVILQKLNEVEAAFAEITDHPSVDFMADLHRFMACVGQNSQEIQPNFVRDMERESPEFFSLIQDRREELIRAHFKKLIAHGRSAGIVRKDISTTLVVEILLSATRAIVNPRKMVELNMTPKTAFGSIIRVVLEGALVRDRRADK